MNHYIEYTNSIEYYKYVGELPSDSKYVKRLIGKHIDGVLYNIDKLVSVHSTSEKLIPKGWGISIIANDELNNMGTLGYCTDYKDKDYRYDDNLDANDLKPYVIYSNNTLEFSFMININIATSVSKFYIESTNVEQITDEYIASKSGGSSLAKYKGLYIVEGEEHTVTTDIIE